MRVSAVLVVGAAAVAMAVEDYGSSLNMTIDPNSVDSGLRATWCQGEYNTCETLCGDDTETNDCTESTLKYECKCTSNSSAPGLQYYQQTMPTYICETLQSQCITQNVGSQKGQDECTSNIGDLCGKLAPPKNPVDSEDATSTTTGPTSSATETSEPTESSGSDSVTSTTADDFAAPTMVPAGAAAAAAIGLLAYLV